MAEITGLVIVCPVGVIEMSDWLSVSRSNGRIRVFTAVRLNE